VPPIVSTRERKTASIAPVNAGCVYIRRSSVGDGTRNWTTKNPAEAEPATASSAVSGPRPAKAVRVLYRRWPRALLVSIDEDAPPTSIHPNRLVNLDRFLALLGAIGLSPATALDVHRHLSLLVLSFALMVDQPADRAGSTGRRPLVPESWLEANAAVRHPRRRRHGTDPEPTHVRRTRSSMTAGWWVARRE
jgi:hypothetical protein